MAFDKIKNDYKHRLLRKANIRRIHIIGCGRSGTTMLHYSMTAFADTILFDRETSPWNHPSIRETREVCHAHRNNPATSFYVTKRGVTWWQGDNVERLADFTRRYGVYLINLVRDPRDVLASKHPLDEKRFYIEPETWTSVIASADRLMAQLGDYADVMTIRYEDIIQDHRTVQRLLYDNIGLELREGIASWDRLKDNLEAAGTDLQRMIPYMHKLRNFDPKTVGKWQSTEESSAYIHSLLTSSPVKDELAAFLKKYEYV